MKYRAALTLWEPSRGEGVTESAGLNGENNEAHTHDEAHITGTWPQSNMTIQEGLPCQSRSLNNYLLTRTEDPSSEDL